MNFLLCHLRHYGFSIMSPMALWISYYVTYDIMAFLLCHLRHNKPHIVLPIAHFISFYKICKHIQFYNYYAFYRIIEIHHHSSYLPWIKITIYNKMDFIPEEKPIKYLLLWIWFPLKSWHQLLSKIFPFSHQNRLKTYYKTLF